MVGYTHSPPLHGAQCDTNLEVYTRTREACALLIVHILELVGHLLARGVAIGIDVVLAIEHATLVIEALDAERSTHIDDICEVHTQGEVVLAQRATHLGCRVLVNLGILRDAVDIPALVILIRKAILICQGSTPEVGVVAERHCAIRVCLQAIDIRQRAEEVCHRVYCGVGNRSTHGVVVEVGDAVVDDTQVEVCQRSRATINGEYATNARHAEALGVVLKLLLALGNTDIEVIGICRLRLRELHHGREAEVALDIHTYTCGVERCRCEVCSERREGVTHTHATRCAVVVRCEGEVLQVAPCNDVVVEGCTSKVLCREAGCSKERHCNHHCKYVKASHNQSIISVSIL